ncbi:hypothetical protein HG531_011720 [Fusarium graminearum]|nr:hypothetical protein HG531_011720 [Fusarium graminearum]
MEMKLAQTLTASEASSGEESAAKAGVRAELIWAWYCSSSIASSKSGSGVLPNIFSTSPMIFKPHIRSSKTLDVDAENAIRTTYILGDDRKHLINAAQRKGGDLPSQRFNLGSRLGLLLVLSSTSRRSETSNLFILQIGQATTPGSRLSLFSLRPSPCHLQNRLESLEPCIRLCKARRMHPVTNDIADSVMRWRRVKNKPELFLKTRLCFAEDVLRIPLHHVMYSVY